MINSINILHFPKALGEGDFRSFVVEINGVEIKGRVQLVGTGGALTYRFYWPKEMSVTQHPDYKIIRIRLLKLMYEQNESMNALSRIFDRV